MWICRFYCLPSRFTVTINIPMEKVGQPAYQSTVEEVLKEQNVTTDGLSSDEARSRIRKFGHNLLTVKKATSPIKIFLYQFSNPLVVLLIISAVISLFLAEFIDAGFIVAIVLINAVVGFVQEYKAENTIQALRRLLSPKAYVVRDGKQIEIDSKNLVPGDIVRITSGNAVPADIRLIDSENLRADESTLTGESVTVEKNAHALSDEAQIADRSNMIFMGTSIVGGKAEGVVIHTGNTTFLGSIAKQTSQAKQEQSPLIKKFSHFARTIGVIVLVSSIVIIAYQIAAGESIPAILKMVVGIAVAAIPEGLPIVATIALSIAVQRMGRKKAIIRNLAAAETLGSTTVICTDKTGTLTMNQMSVVKIFDGHDEHEPHLQYDPTNRHISDLLHCGVLCTEVPEIHSNKENVSLGDPTDTAVVIASQRKGVLAHDIKEWKYLDILPFQNEKRMMAALVQKEERKVLYVKGSPEKIFEISGVSHNKELLNKVEEFAENGLRVIACAEKKMHTGEKITDEHLNSGFAFLGLFALIDPPRPDVKDAIQLCQKAGIRVVMVTGDHPTTAAAIAKQLGISDKDQLVKTGQEIMHMSEKELLSDIKNISVFARVTPDQKLRIVKAYKDSGEIVAVTGDGVNDAPALRSAHIGVAMGGRGTDVAKEASSMVILDDSFSTIVMAIKEARVLFENLRKATFFLIPTGFSVILTVFASIILGYPMPFTAVQLLWVNIVTNGLQDVSLAFEPEESGVLSRPPRKPTEGIMSPLLYRRSVIVALVITIGVIAMYTSAVDSGASLLEARTIALSTMIIFQFLQLLNARSETISIFKLHLFSNKLLLVSMALALFAFLLTLTFPPLQWLLATTPIKVSTLLQILLMACTVIVVVEIDKAIIRKFHVKP